MVFLAKLDLLDLKPGRRHAPNGFLGNGMGWVEKIQDLNGTGNPGCGGSDA
jgi:hypothetical protein